MNDEERIRDYLRHRADVRVPDDLQWPSAAAKPRRWWTAAPLGARGGVAAAGAVVIVLAAGLLLRPTGPSGPGLPSGSLGASSSASTPPPPAGTFPAEVAGLSVMTVAHAVELLQAGKLDGQAIAVAGYYNAFYPSCPYPGRYIGPLETWCSFSAFTDTAAGAQLCEPYGSNGTTCHRPTGISLAPFFVSETSGNASAYLTSATGEPAPLVLIGHGGDARQWLCTTTTQDECAHAFVVDRVAWAQGHDVPLTAAQTGNQQSGQPISPKMTLAEVTAAAGLGDSVVAAAALRAGDIATVDPRWTFAGDNVLWLVRSIAPGAASPDQATSAETVWLVDDATDVVVDRHPLKLDPAYQPARLWQIATVHGYDCCAGNLEAFAAVQKSDGNLVYQGLVSNSASGGLGSTTFGGGYNSAPLVLPAGTYTITNWIADYISGVMGTPRDQCSTQVTLGPLDNATVNSDFPAGQACTFGPAPSSSPGT
jgi:hypothetical protein